MAFDSKIGITQITERTGVILKLYDSPSNTRASYFLIPPRQIEVLAVSFWNFFAFLLSQAFAEFIPQDWLVFIRFSNTVTRLDDSNATMTSCWLLLNRGCSLSVSAGSLLVFKDDFVFIKVFLLPYLIFMK